jgi:hypothetical protein
MAAAAAAAVAAAGSATDDVRARAGAAKSGGKKEGLNQTTCTCARWLRYGRRWFVCVVAVGLGNDKPAFWWKWRASTNGDGSSAVRSNEKTSNDAELFYWEHSVDVAAVEWFCAYLTRGL